MRDVTYTDLDFPQRNLLCRAEEVMENAYSPYSNFFVGAALLAKHNNIIISGCNVENAAYGSTICAERGAIMRANAEGIRGFSKVAIIARGANFKTKEVTGPCGSCRQMLYESAQVSDCDLEIIMSTTDKDKIVIATIKELLPLGFGPVDLGIDINRFRK